MEITTLFYPEPHNSNDDRTNRLAKLQARLRDERELAEQRARASRYGR